MPGMNSPLTIYAFSQCFHGLDQIFTCCYKVMRCRVTPQKLFDSCNGLLLFCHKDGEAENLTVGAYDYYVINCVTKQCVAVVKPIGVAGPSAPMYSYAALAYDPEESWFFKIVRFQGCRHINVFSSETGCWTTLTLQLPQEVNKAVWVKKSIYAHGAVYRLSSSRHLLKSLVDHQENVQKQAEVIKLPCTRELENYHWDIGEKNLDVMFVLATGESVTIWKLDECIKQGVYSYQWTEIHKTIHMYLLLG
ncbi:hypothetical protein SESBI_09082 [Sesbania bispinosa]|nr:hypothetical protein SESBI_09082 [Sesbania bispinosa]